MSVTPENVVSTNRKNFPTKVLASALVIVLGVWALSDSNLPWTPTQPPHSPKNVTPSLFHKSPIHVGQVNLGDRHHDFNRNIETLSLDGLLQNFKDDLASRGLELDHVSQNKDQIMAWSKPNAQGQRQALVARSLGPQRSVVYRVSESERTRLHAQNDTLEASPTDLPTPLWSKLSYAHDQENGRRQLRIFQCEGNLEQVKMRYLEALTDQGWQILKPRKPQKGLEDFFTLYKDQGVCYVQVQNGGGSPDSSNAQTNSVILTLILENKTS